MINSLTFFRFIIALIIFLFHCNIHFNWKTNITLLDHFFKNSATFMSGFFILSGFIMSYVYQNIDLIEKENMINFYIKRFAKVYPIYSLATILYFCIFHHYSASEFTLIIINDIFLIQAFFPSIFNLGLNGGTWSLSVEAFLYFLFPFIIRITKFNVKKMLAICFSLVLIISINALLNKADNIYSNPIFRTPEFIIGICCHQLFSKKYLNKYFSILSLVVLFFSSILLGDIKYHYCLGQFIIVSAFGLLISSVYHSKNKFYDNYILIYLGKISYSFYIWQFIAIELGKYLMLNEYLINLNLIVFCSLMINIIISSLSFTFIEEPLRKLIINKIHAKKIF